MCLQGELTLRQMSNVGLVTKNKFNEISLSHILFNRIVLLFIRAIQNRQAGN